MVELLQIPELTVLPKRVLVYGVTGSGKTSLAKQLSEITGIEATEVDNLTFEPGWVTVPDEVQIERISTICSRDGWILDSAYAKWLPTVLPKTDLIICLDYHRLVSLSRLFGRTISRAITMQPVCNGNTESWKLMFSRESILVWHFKSFQNKKRRMAAWAAGDPAACELLQPGCQILRLTSPKQCDAWVSQLQRR